MNFPEQNNAGTNAGPETVGRFEITRQLGQGAQSVVYLAHDPQLECQVAIKTLDRRRKDHSHLLHEARNVSKLEHHSIIPIYEIGIHQDMPYLVYPYIEWQSLREIPNEKRRLLHISH